MAEKVVGLDKLSVADLATLVKGTVPTSFEHQAAMQELIERAKREKLKQIDAAVSTIVSAVPEAKRTPEFWQALEVLGTRAKLSIEKLSHA